jgi:hypothetical protein
MSEPRPNTHAVSAIRARLAEVSGELIAVEKRWRSLREAHHSLSQTLRMFDPDADAGQIRPKRSYRRVLPRGGRKLSLLVIDALRVSGRPMSMPDVMAALGNRVEAIPNAERRVRAALNYLARSRGIIAKEGELSAALWSLSLTGSGQR